MAKTQQEADLVEQEARVKDLLGRASANEGLGVERASRTEENQGACPRTSC